MGSLCVENQAFAIAKRDLGVAHAAILGALAGDERADKDFPTSPTLESALVKLGWHVGGAGNDIEWIEPVVPRPSLAIFPVLAPYVARGSFLICLWDGAHEPFAFVFTGDSVHFENFEERLSAYDNNPVALIDDLLVPGFQFDLSAYDGREPMEL